MSGMTGCGRKWVKLGDLCDIKSGGTPKRSVREYWTNGDIPWVKISDINGKYVTSTEEFITQSGLDHSSAKLLEPGTILFSIFASIGAVGVLDMRAATNQAIAALRIKSSLIERDYLFHWLKSQKSVSRTAGRGVAQSNINLSILRNMEVPVPDVVKQKEIARQLEAIGEWQILAEGFLGRFDDLVKSRFIEMFGDPAQNPMNWETVGLTSLGTCKNGMSFKSKESGIELPCLGVGDFKDRIFINDVSEMGRVNLDTEPSEGCFLKDGDVVFVRSNGNKELVGRCLAVYPGDAKAVYSGFCIRLRIESKKVRIPYLVWVLRQPSIRRQMFGRGANVQNLNQKLMAQVMVPLPPLSEQDRFVDFVAQIDKTKVAVQQSIDKLQMLYDSLAQEYFGGDR